MNIITKKSEEKNATKNFFQKHTNRISKKRWKKIVSKSAEHVFYKHMNIVTKKWGGKNARKNFFLKHTYIASKKG